jgi:DNA-binding transcriptional LysR family regulator
VAGLQEGRLPMDLSKIRYFLKAAELENFSEAAEECNISQATMSKYISNLEEEVGFELFAREHRKAFLTPSGRRLYRGLRQIEDDYHKLLLEIRDSTKKEIRVGIAMQEYFEIPGIQSYQENNPNISVNFNFDNLSNLEKQLSSHAIDAVLYSSAQEGSHDFQAAEVFETGTALFINRDLWKKYQNIPAILKNETLITKTDFEWYLSRLSEQMKAIYGTAIGKIEKRDMLMDQLMQLNQKKGYAILPLTTAHGFDQVILVPLDASVRSKVFMEYRPGDNNTAIRGFVDSLRVK